MRHNHRPDPNSRISLTRKIRRLWKGRDLSFSFACSLAIATSSPRRKNSSRGVVSGQRGVEPHQESAVSEIISEPSHNVLLIYADIDINPIAQVPSRYICEIFHDIFISASIFAFAGARQKKAKSSRNFSESQSQFIFRSFITAPLISLVVSLKNPSGSLKNIGLPLNPLCIQVTKLSANLSMMTLAIVQARPSKTYSFIKSDFSKARC